MSITKRLLEEMLEEDFYDCDMDYDYQQWVINKELEDQEECINNYLSEKEAYEEMLADKY
jgi:frataxin-like iron-binding protein CyaY